MLEALGESSIEKAIDVMKQLTNEFIFEQEKQDKLNREIDALLDGVDFSEPLSPIYHIQVMKTCQHIQHHLNFR